MWGGSFSFLFPFFFRKGKERGKGSGNKKKALLEELTDRLCSSFSIKDSLELGREKTKNFLFLTLFFSLPSFKGGDWCNKNSPTKYKKKDYAFFF